MFPNSAGSAGLASVPMVSLRDTRAAREVEEHHGLGGPKQISLRGSQLLGKVPSTTGCGELKAPEAFLS